MSALRDKYEIRRGKIELFRRVGHISSKDGKYRQSDRWYAAIRLRGYKTVRRSLKTDIQEEAEQIAEDLYQELLHKTKRGLSLKSRRFGLICAGFLKQIEIATQRDLKLPKEKRSYTTNQLRNKKLVINNFITPILGQKNIEDINDLDIEEYIQKRKLYWISGVGSTTDTVSYKRGKQTVVRPRISSEKREPNYSTINKDLTVLRQIFDYARMTKLIDGKQIPTITNLRKPKNMIAKKPSLAISQYRSLIRKLQWKIRKQENPKHKRSHTLLYYYILILANSGLRVAEAKNLRFSDISSFKDPAGNKHIKMFVHGKGKSRVMVPLQRTKKYIDELKYFHQVNASLHGWKYSDDLQVFTSERGNPIGSFKNGLNNLLRESNLLYSEDGRKRSAGTFRKFYMTMRLINGGVGIYDLAKNVGSSVAVVETFYAELEPEHIAQDLTRLTRYREINPIQIS